MPRSFRLRGIVEGFYGRPWSHGERLDVLSFVAQRGMNAYVYAPKDDPKHRQRWREPYGPDEMAGFGALAAHCGDHGIELGLAISPGLDIAYDDPGDRAALLEKLRPFTDIGVGWFVLALDDIPPVAGVATRQAELAGWLLTTLQELGDARLTVCPTEYVGTHPSPYLSDLAAGLPEEVDLLWTGRTVCSPEIVADEACAWSTALGGRAPLVWDNYPVNDGPMAPSLHLGPYRGRDPALADVTRGVLCNPMSQARASMVALATAAEFLADPDAYEPDAAWERALREVGGELASPLRAVARACADSPISRPSDLDVAHHVGRVADTVDGPGWIAPVAALATVLRATRDAAASFPPGAVGLAGEIAPWAGAAHREAEVGLSALRLLQHVHPAVARDPDGNARIGIGDAERGMHLSFLLLVAWNDVRRRSEHVVFGPRHSVHPGVVRGPDGHPALDVALSLAEDANAIDRLCRLALFEYAAWSADVHDHPEVSVDGAPRAVAADGTFEAGGDVVLVRSGRWATRMRGAEALPFRDPRVA